MQARTVIGVFAAAGAVFWAAAQPIITVEPQNQTIIENGPCTFSVEATGNGPLHYQWLENTNFASSGILPGETSPVLHFPSRSYTFHGFSVVVSDANGAVTSRVARINYTLRFLAHPASQVVTQGVTPQLSASAEGTVPFRYQWQFHNRPLPNETNAALSLPDVEPADSGPYRLLLSSSVGSVTSRIANLTVLPGTNAPVVRPTFVNFETAPVHPIALSPDHSRLAACNLPDARLEIFDVRSGSPRPIGSVPVGIDPVSVRFRTSNEVWVVNHISDSVNVIDLNRMHVLATVQTLDAPADVVFAGDPPRAFVSCAMENAVLVFDVLTHERLATIPIDGERPKAMCVSPDGSRVYVAIFESGNASTILAPIFGIKGQPAIHTTLTNASGPYGGRNPPPNRGTNFSPAINPNLNPQIPMPRDAHIVKKNAAGRWMDDNNGDWTLFVSGTNSELSGRVFGWDMPDRDVAIINAENLDVQYASGLMNLCMDIAVNPVTKEITVVGTDARNEVRFEPNLKGTFLRVNLARYDPDTGTKVISDLNPHLDYSTSTVPLIERRKSIGDPRGIVWDAAGTRGYISGMGSDNLIAVDASGNRVGEALELEAGACGMVLDESRDRLYVFNRFANTISTVDLEDRKTISSVQMFDPTPAAIKTGRKHLYDTHKTSGLGYVSCASCHPEGRMDRLAWDLGDPSGTNVTVGPRQFHPMKGPMVTLTLQDIIGHEPFHWRGDRQGIKDFNQTFPALMGGPLLTTNEMREFKEFLATLTFPPNRHRNFDNTLSTNLPLTGHLAAERRGNAGAPLPNGNARRGLDQFNLQCVGCHRLPSGLGPDLSGPGGVNPGPDGERLVNSIALSRNSALPFKMVQLRNLPDKMGMDLRKPSSRTGFGFTFSGRSDTLARFFDFGFTPPNDQQVADMVAFLLSFAGSDFPVNPVAGGLPSRDVPASAGKQVTLASAEMPTALDQAMALASARRSRLELLIKSERRTWLYSRQINSCQSDRAAESIGLDEVSRLAATEGPLTFLLVPQGTGKRMALDRDGDGYLDGDELDAGSDPANARSIPLLARLRLSSGALVLSWNSVTGRVYRIEVSDDLSTGWTSLGNPIVASGTSTTVTQSLNGGLACRFYRIVVPDMP